MSKIIAAAVPGFLYLGDRLFFAYTHCSQQYDAQMGEGMIGYRDFILVRMLILIALVVLGEIVCRKYPKSSILANTFFVLVCVVELLFFITVPPQEDALAYTKACFPYGA